MDTEMIRQYCLNKQKACETYPFGDVPICYKLNNRIFAQLYPDKIVRGYHCPPIQQPYWNIIHFFDNLFTDWAVSDRINQSHASVQKVKHDILATLSELERMEEKTATGISALEIKIEELLVNS